VADFRVTLSDSLQRLRGHREFHDIYGDIKNFEIEQCLPLYNRLGKSPKYSSINMLPRLKQCRQWEEISLCRGYPIEAGIRSHCKARRWYTPLSDVIHYNCYSLQCELIFIGNMYNIYHGEGIQYIERCGLT